MITAFIVSILSDPCYIEYIFSVVIVTKHYGKKTGYAFVLLLFTETERLSKRKSAFVVYVKTIAETKIIFWMRKIQTIMEKSYAIIIPIVKNIIARSYNTQRLFNQFMSLLLDTFNKYNKLLWTLSREFINISKDFYVGLLELGSIQRHLRI